MERITPGSPAEALQLPKALSQIDTGRTQGVNGCHVAISTCHCTMNINHKFTGFYELCGLKNRCQEFSLDVSYCVKNVHSLVDWQKDHHSKIPSKLGTGQQTAMCKWFAHGLYRGLGTCWVLVWMQLLFWQFEYRFQLR